MAICACEQEDGRGGGSKPREARDLRVRAGGREGGRSRGTRNLRVRAGGREEGNCNEHGTIYIISSDFGDRMTTQSMELILLLSEYF